MRRWTLYALSEGDWESTRLFPTAESFVGKRYAPAEAKTSEGQTEENKNAAKVFRAFVAEKTIVVRADFKRLMRALRHFDEVGLSNDIYDAIEEINDGEDVQAVAFAGTEEGFDGSRRGGIYSRIRFDFSEEL